MDTIEKAIEKLGKLDSGALQAKRPAAPDPFAATPVERPVPKAEARPEEAKRNSGKRTKRSVALDLNRIRQAGMVVPDTKRSRIKEEYRHIKRPLLMNASGKGATLVDYPNLIMVTSALPGEGKTFTAINLALSIASERDRTVLLVDADVVKPSISKFFGFESGPGLVDYLIEDTLDLSEVLVETNVPSLTVLPAGNTHHLSTELLGSENMHGLAREMSMRYSDRIVIFDSPPLLATTEASVLANLVGQVVMVVEAEKTRRAQVQEALSMLHPDMIVGFVLNKSRSRAGTSYYNPYYYGYGYGYGDSGRD